jgi:hypothetical protein
MLYRELKKVANESIINPKKCSPAWKIVLDINNPDYWKTKAMELIKISTTDESLREAITLLILTRTKLNEEARNNNSKKDNGVSKTS